MGMTSISDKPEKPQYRHSKQTTYIIWLDKTTVQNTH